MKTTFLLAACFCLFLTAGPARAQTGSLDQMSPIPLINPTGFSTDQAFVWQQQVRAGLTGQLEGIVIQLMGAPGGQVQVTLRMGPAWNTSPAVFQTNVTKGINNPDNIFVDVTSANIQVVPGTLFVIEVFGLNTGNVLVQGSHVIVPQPPPYPEPLFVNGSCLTDCLARFGFMSFVRTPSSIAYCPGDGSGTACPCANAGWPGNGCANSTEPAGAHLNGVGLASIGNDSFVLSGSRMPSGTAMYFQGSLRTAGGAGASFGDGLRCAGGTITRLSQKTNVGGASSYPNVGDLPISVMGANSAGAVREYQCWYRDAAPFCTSSTFNLTNGLEVTWTP